MPCVPKAEEESWWGSIKTPSVVSRRQVSMCFVGPCVDTLTLYEIDKTSHTKRLFHMKGKLVFKILNILGNWEGSGPWLRP
jgi:hypothetical protein